MTQASATPTPSWWTPSAHPQASPPSTGGDYFSSVLASLITGAPPVRQAWKPSDRLSPSPGWWIPFYTLTPRLFPKYQISAPRSGYRRPLRNPTWSIMVKVLRLHSSCPSASSILSYPLTAEGSLSPPFEVAVTGPLRSVHEHCDSQVLGLRKNPVNLLIVVMAWFGGHPVAIPTDALGVRIKTVR